jgi:hypothetical protein
VTRTSIRERAHAGTVRLKNDRHRLLVLRETERTRKRQLVRHQSRIPSGSIVYFPPHSPMILFTVW